MEDTGGKVRLLVYEATEWHYELVLLEEAEHCVILTDREAVEEHLAIEASVESERETYMALTKDNIHWVTVVMHKEKEEFQVLDSLMKKELDNTTRKLVEDLRRKIGADIAEANATGSVQYPDVSTLPIKTYDMPQQEDG
ncbi:hypothetical protein ZWY2020_059094 [Hordeum vulgare]|nr:hypothetical protein ZWY2020_059090 [Hordeum vulgare]KAI5022364.1 hypothetical protein ZWY2020_059094 [Hordeum vulgare]